MGDTREVVGRRRRSRGEAEGLIRDFEQSGLTRKAFCEAREVAVHTMDYYRHRERSRGVATQAGEIVPVELIGGTSTGGSVRIELPNGRPTVVYFYSAEYMWVIDNLPGRLPFVKYDYNGLDLY